MKKSATTPCMISLIFFAILFCCCATPVFSQGGPPMQTDDSGVPGDGKWENNFAFEFEGSKNDYVRSFPIIDLNYGLGDRIQLKAELTWAAEKEENLAHKFDNITLGFKYLILDGKEEGFSLSIYPQPIISFNPNEEEGKSPVFGIALPVAMNKEIAEFGVNLQAGYQILGKASELFLGLAIDHDIGEHLTLLAELHTTIGRTPDIDATGESAVYFKAGTFLNIGAQIKLFEHFGILAGFGKDLETPPLSTDDANLYGYFGLQFLM